MGVGITFKAMFFSSTFQQVLIPYDPKEKHLRVDKNVTLRVYCKDKAPGKWCKVLCTDSTRAK